MCPWSKGAVQVEGSSIDWFAERLTSYWRCCYWEEAFQKLQATLVVELKGDRVEQVYQVVQGVQARAQKAAQSCDLIPIPHHCLLESAVVVVDPRHR